MTDKRLRIVFAGSGEFGIPSLRALVGANYEIPLVVTQLDRPAGRGREITPTPIASLAVEANLPLLKTGNINNESLPQADVLVVIAFGQKIAPHIADQPPLGSVNLHASRLPKYRGAAPINWAIMRGETVTGNSIIRLAQRMDAGPILAQSSLEIGELETAGELHDRLAVDGAPLLLEALGALADGTAREVAQDDSQATLAPKLSRESAHIDWTRPAEQIARQIRGLFPWPGCRVKLIAADGSELDRVTLARARARDGASSAPAGSIADSLAVVAGDRREVEIVELQPQGKKLMSLSAYRNGHKWETRMRLESAL